MKVPAPQFHYPDIFNSNIKFIFLFICTVCTDGEKEIRSSNRIRSISCFWHNVLTLVLYQVNRKKKQVDL